MFLPLTDKYSLFDEKVRNCIITGLLEAAWPASVHLEHILNTLAKCMAYHKHRFVLACNFCIYVRNLCSNTFKQIIQEN
jgi:hypothetical protein